MSNTSNYHLLNSQSLFLRILATYWFMNNFNLFLFSRDFIIIYDQPKSLKYSVKILNPCQSRS